jgi:hypothetical protein
MTPEQHERRGRQFAAEFALKSAIKRQFGSVTHLFKNVLGMDESILADLKEPPEMPRYRTPATRRATDSRRARDMIGDMNVLDAIESLMSELTEEEAAELQERMAGDRGGRRDLLRRSASDDPADFPGMPRTGGTMVPAGREPDAIDRWRRPGEDRRHAQDRRQHAYDELSDRHGYGRKGFLERFPGAAHIKVM